MQHNTITFGTGGLSASAELPVCILPNPESCAHKEQNECN